MKKLKDHINESTMKHTTAFVIIKPGFLDKTDDIIDELSEEYSILKREVKLLSYAESKDIYSPHEKEDFYEQLCIYMSSGPCCGLLLTPKVKSSLRKTKDSKPIIYKKDNDMIGHISYIKDLVRKKWGVNPMKNVMHSSDSEENVYRESSIFFNKQ